MKSTIVLLLVFIIRLCYSSLRLLDEPNSRDVYSVKLFSNHIFNEIIMKNESIGPESLENIGSNLQCFIPDILEDENDSTELNEVELKQRLLYDLSEGLDIIKSVLNQTCIYFPNGFWTYSLCHKNNRTVISQFYKTDERLVIYNLGSVHDNDISTNIQLLYNDYGYYISEILDSGDICDITGYPRKTEIHYICDPMSSNPKINWLRETRICQYQIEVSLPELCNLELLQFSKMQQSSNSILCTKQMPSDTPKMSLNDYDPSFVGHGFYFLTPHSHDFISSSQEKTILIYTEYLQLSSPRSELTLSEQVFFERISKAFGNILNQGLIKTSSEYIYSVNDRFTWVSDVYDFNMTRIATLKVDIGENNIATFMFIDPLEGGNLEFDNVENREYSMIESNNKILVRDITEGSNMLHNQIKSRVNKEQRNKLKKLFSELAETLNSLSDEELSDVLDSELKLGFEIIKDANTQLTEMNQIKENNKIKSTTKSENKQVNDEL